MATPEEIFSEAMTLSPEVRAELAERLIGSLAEDVSPEITSAQIAEVRRRIAEVESGEATLTPGNEVLARARCLLPDPHRESYSSPMATIFEVEKLALNLSEQERAKLAADLLNSLPGVLSDEDGGVADALRRDAELKRDPKQTITLAQLDSHVRSRF